MRARSSSRKRASLSRLGAAALVLALAAPAAAMDTAPATDLPDLSAIRAQIYAGAYEEAVAALLPLTATVKHADLYNLLGFALRNLKRYDEAARWYKEAIYYDPLHRPALEYQGELFIAVGNLAAAEKNLEMLRLLCFPTGCEEFDRLKGALATAGRPPDPAR